MTLRSQHSMLLAVSSWHHNIGFSLYKTFLFTLKMEWKIWDGNNNKNRDNIRRLRSSYSIHIKQLLRGTNDKEFHLSYSYVFTLQPTVVIQRVFMHQIENINEIHCANKHLLLRQNNLQLSRSWSIVEWCIFCCDFLTFTSELRKVYITVLYAMCWRIASEKRQFSAGKLS